ncbi:Arsenic resistance transcriptional regulator ArsR1 [Neomoorella glycerini]|uniref:Arsenic resistance transcriptional regulator ArsR1 n=1 Tax=Neomoorella glycerini TaxID=55779 RepID=A0A6I5ZUE5_9FIRM|nr:Arsenic resistance transcriptional regulator ArsR1 [Moorella glycerini]
MDRLQELFKILADETRLRILLLLYRKELCVCEISNILQVSQPKVSRHLAKLRDLGYVRDERQGQWIFYHLRIDNQLSKEILEKIISHIQEYPAALKDLERLSEMEKNKRLCERKNL